MKTVSEIKKIGKGERYYLYLDDEFFGIYEAEILARHCLKTGDTFDDDFWEALKIENGDYACFNRGLSVLEKSMKSEKMLKDYLKQKGYPDTCIDKAVEKIKSYGYIDDSQFCESYISSYAREKSKRKLKYDLLAKGIDKQIIEEKLNDMINEENEYEICQNIANKYLKNKELDIKTKQKFYNHMAGKGFEFSLISRTWEDFVNGRN